MSIRSWHGSLQKALVLGALVPLALAATTAGAQNTSSVAPETSAAKPARHPRRRPAPPAPVLSGTPTEVQIAGPAASASVNLPPPPSRAAAARRKATIELRQMVSSPGFRMLSDGSSRVEVSVLGSPKVLQYQVPGAVVYVFQHAMVPVHNNQNPLVTRFFNTPVADARLRQVGQDVHLIVELRAQAMPQARVVELVPNKVLALQVDFPPGNYWTEPVADPARGRRARSSPASTSPYSASQPAPPTTSDGVMGPPSP